MLLKQQLIIHSRSRQRAPNLTSRDRTLLGFMSLLLNPRRFTRSAIIIKPSTLLSFHNALRNRKYRLLYSARGGTKPGPKGPSKEVIKAIVEMKQRNPCYGCPRIAQQINLSVPNRAIAPRATPKICARGDERGAVCYLDWPPLPVVGARQASRDEARRGSARGRPGL